MSLYVENCEVGVEPLTDQDRHDLKAEREMEEYAEMYAAVRAERDAAGLMRSEIQVAAETMRRLRLKYAI